MLAKKIIQPAKEIVSVSNLKPAFELSETITLTVSPSQKSIPINEVINSQYGNVMAIIGHYA